MILARVRERTSPSGGKIGSVAAVINLLRFQAPVDAELFERAARDLTPQMRAIDGFQEFLVVQASETEAILVILGDDVDVLNRIATEVGSPWMVANVVPLLAAPPERHIGPIIARSPHA